MPQNDYLGSRTSAVVAAFRGVAEVTSPSWRVQFEGGDYDRVYVKPNAKLGSALLTSRELLVVVTTFSDLQARTVKLVQKLLQDAQGRLEAGMAVVFHADPSGNERLREWGRERGVTVLPVYMASTLPEGAELVGALCESLYSQDPFDLAGPVRLPHQFFGRTEVPDMARRLRSGHIQALFGIRKIGKTSVLHRVLEEARDFHGMGCVMADCSDDSLSELSAGRLLHSIAGGVNDAISFEESHYTSLMPLTEDISPAEAGRVLLNVLTRADRPVVLLLDEVDYITPSSPVARHWEDDFNPFFRSLRQVYQEACRRSIAFSVVLCGVSSHWFTVESVAGVENAALALVPENYLPPLERRHAVGMVETLGRSAGLIFSSSAAAQVAETCADIPFWIRKAGSFVNSCFGHDVRPTKLDASDVGELCEEFVDVEGAQLAFSSLRHLFRMYPQLGTVAVDCLNGRKLDEHPQPLLSALGRYGILGAGFAASGPMMERGLRLWEREEAERPAKSQLALDPSATIEAGSASAAGEEEWADLLSEVSHRRNTLERELREFVLAVLRVVAATSAGKKPGEMILASVSAERRSELTEKNSGALLKSLYWAELINIVKKHWPSFEKYFGDRKQLDLFSDIINDRPDAHAKDFDGADLALQRRAINWFQTRLNDSELL